MCRDPYKPPVRSVPSADLLYTGQSRVRSHAKIFGIDPFIPVHRLFLSQLLPFDAPTAHFRRRCRFTTPGRATAVRVAMLLLAACAVARTCANRRCSPRRRQLLLARASALPPTHPPRLCFLSPAKPRPPLAAGWLVMYLGGVCLRL